MAYCTLDAILKMIPVGTFLQLSDDSGLVTPEALSIALAGGDMSGFADDVQDATAKVQEKSAEAIDGAAAEINGYCAGRYDVPFNPVPGIVAKVAADLAIYNLYARVVEAIPETRQKQHDAALKLLEKIAEGRISLGTTDAAVAPSPMPANSIQVKQAAPTFISESLRNY